MQEAVPVGVGAMAAILGLEGPAVEKACQEAAQGEVVSAANLNSPGQIVIAGHSAAVDRAIALCKAAGAKRGMKLNVSAPFHCALMRPAQERLAQVLGALTFRDLAVPLVANVDARAVRTGADCRDGLVRQVSGAVRWQESVELLAREGVTTFVEVGPGHVLGGLVKKIVKDATMLHVHDAASLRATVAALGKA
jgi:[acyl-carrier-protein] S-malonyltransferase